MAERRRVRSLAIAAAVGAVVLAVAGFFVLQHDKAQIEAFYRDRDCAALDSLIVADLRDPEALISALCGGYAKGAYHDVLIALGLKVQDEAPAAAAGYRRFARLVLDAWRDRLDHRYADALSTGFVGDRRGPATGPFECDGACADQGRPRVGVRYVPKELVVGPSLDTGRVVDLLAARAAVDAIAAAERRLADLRELDDVRHRLTAGASWLKRGERDRFFQREHLNIFVKARCGQDTEPHFIYDWSKAKTYVGSDGVAPVARRAVAEKQYFDSEDAAKLVSLVGARDPRLTLFGYDPRQAPADILAVAKFYDGQVDKLQAFARDGSQWRSIGDDEAIDLMAPSWIACVDIVPIAEPVECRYGMQGDVRLPRGVTLQVEITGWRVTVVSRDGDTIRPAMNVAPDAASRARVRCPSSIALSFKDGVLDRTPRVQPSDDQLAALLQELGPDLVAR